MNENLQKLADKAEDYADMIVDQGGEFHRTYTKCLVENLLIDIIGELYREYPESNKMEKLVEKLCYRYGIVKNDA